MGTKRKEFQVPIQKLTTVPKDFEEVLENLGGFGRFQLLTLVLLLVLEIPTAFLSFLPIFTGAGSRHWTCNGEVIGYEERCSCNGTLDSDESSIVTEWGLVCGSEWVSDFITSLQMLGMVFGNISAGTFSDWYGRKNSFLATVLVMALGSAASAAVSDPYTYGFARLLCGAGLSGFLGITSVYTMEFLTPKWRPLGGGVGPWGEGIMLLSLLAYYIQPWRMLTLATTLPFALILIIYPILPESPRWLLRNQKIHQAHKVLNQIAKMNGKEPLSLELVKKLAAIEANPSGIIERFTYWDFFRRSDLRLPSIYLMGIWAAWSIVNFGIAFNIKNFPGNIYVNVAILGLTDVIGYPASLLISNKLGRRRSLALFMVIAAVFLVVLAVAVELIPNPEISQMTVVVLCLIGKLGISGARGCVRTLTGETYPTAIRSMGACLCGVSSGLASILAPQLAFLGSRWAAIPYFSFAFISVVGAMISFLLQETQGQALTSEVKSRADAKEERA